MVVEGGWGSIAVAYATFDGLLACTPEPSAASARVEMGRSQGELMQPCRALR